MGEGIHEDALVHLVQQHAVRECLVARVDGGPDWGLSIRLGGSGAALGAGQVTPGEGAHLGQPDRRRALCRWHWAQGL
jgi:hypothetical protein